MFWATITGMIPTNVFQSLNEANILQLRFLLILCTHFLSKRKKTWSYHQWRKRDCWCYGLMITKSDDHRTTWRIWPNAWSSWYIRFGAINGCIQTVCCLHRCDPNLRLCCLPTNDSNLHQDFSQEVSSCNEEASSGCSFNSIFNGYTACKLWTL